jgi:deoxyribodipyrimidine photo-lyase
MWFAGWWIHIERLPWQLGADFFLRHLLDGDPASNTLSWRWVAGLQTPGKIYLPRRSNLEKYLPSEVLEVNHEGLEQLEHPQALILTSEARPAITRPSLPPTPSLHEGRIGIWIHEEDLLIEQSPLTSLHPKAIIATRDTATWTRLRYPEIKTTWLLSAIDDAAKRASNTFGIDVEVSSDSSITQALVNWANKNKLQQIATMRPEIGPLHDQLDHLQAALSNVGIELIFFDRPEDLALRPLATGGFFGFWEKMQKTLGSVM